MKYVRAVAIFLILIMASSPLLAAACSISCAAGSVVPSISAPLNAIASDASAKTEDHCQHGMATDDKHESVKHAPDKHPSNAEHKGCTMAGGCHLAQATLVSPMLSVSANHTDTTLPPFTPLALAADVPPPIKPPA